MECTLFKTVKSVGVPDRQIQAVVLFVLESLKKKNAAVSVHCIGESQMRRLNRVHRGKDKVTDVLSFAMQEGAFMMEKKGEDKDWGDIFICIPQIKRQAKEYGVRFKEEFFRMTVHGVLHLLGYDHEEEKEAKKMFSLQDKMVVSCLKQFSR